MGRPKDFRLTAAPSFGWRREEAPSFSSFSQSSREKYSGNTPESSSRDSAQAARLTASRTETTRDSLL